MLSVISSYKIASPSMAVLPVLGGVCRELDEKDFLAVDVIISEADIRAAAITTVKKGRLDSLHQEKGVLATLARALAAAISEAVSARRGAPLAIPALASNFPNISNLSTTRDSVSHEYLWEGAVNSLAVCLLVAHDIGVKVVEIVCGRCVEVHVDEAEHKIRVSSLNDSGSSGTVTRIRKRFVEGVWRAFARAYDELDAYMLPQAAVALEMEPDILALAHEVADLQTLLHDLDEGPELRGELERLSGLRNELQCHFGLNLDWGHFLVALDRVDPVTEYAQSQQAWAILDGPLRQRVLHGHVSDHAPGAHWIDGSVGAFRSLRHFERLLRFQSEVIQETDKRRKECGLSRCSSGAVAIELEACGDVGMAVQTRDRLEKLAKELGSPLVTESDLLAKCEHTIAVLPSATTQLGWFEGVNSALYHALEKLLYRSREPGLGEQALLDETLLQRIRQFLVTRKNDERTWLAVQIMNESFRRGGVTILSNWTNYLLHQEYWGAFSPPYRDHTVHAVYVYLLGWFFYVECAPLRELISGAGARELRRPTVEWAFAWQWMVAALAHDVGYPFESEKKDFRNDALERINLYHKMFVAWAILAKGDPLNKTYLLLKRENAAIMGDLGDPFLNADSKKEPFPVPSDEESKDLSKYSLAQRSGLFDAISPECLQKFGLGQNSLSQIYDFLSAVKPQGSLGREGPFLDHGIMSGAILAILKKIHDEGAKRIEENGKKIREKPEDAVTRSMIDDVRDWPAKYRSSKWSTLPLEDLLAAIATHNIYPEPIGVERGNLHSPADVGKHCPILRNFRIGEGTPLALLLAMCDSLQEWHRYGFVNPTWASAFVLEPLEVDVYVDLRSRRVCLGYPGNDQLVDKKEREFDARFGDTWRRFVEFRRGV